MKNIIIMSEEEAIIYSLRKNVDKTIIISITKPTSKKVDFDGNPNILSVLHVQFFEQYRKSMGAIMNEDIARDIKTFVDAWADKADTILVHCRAGLNRSPAVAAALSVYLNGDDSHIWNSGLYAPDRHCYKTLLSVLT